MMTRTWTTAEKQIITDNWGIMPPADIAVLAGHGENATIGKARRMGLWLKEYHTNGLHENAKRNRTDLTSYKDALPESEWPKAQAFLHVVAIAKKHAEKTGAKADIRLDWLRDEVAKIGVN